MRIMLEFEVGVESFALDYRSIFISFIKKALSECFDGRYYDRYFQDTVQKNYTFSVQFGRAKYNKEFIALENKNIRLLFSSEDRNKTGLIFFSAFLKQKNTVFPLPNGNTMLLKRVSQIKEQEIQSPKVIFKTTLGSGLCIREHDKAVNRDTYYVFRDKDFDARMKEVLYYQARQAGFSEHVASNIEMRPIQWKKVVAKHYGCYVDLSIGMFEMTADQTLLQYFYQAGVGSRHSAGFGMVDLITQDLL